MALRRSSLSLEEIPEILELLDRVRADSGDEDALGRFALYAALAAERCERLRHRLALASELTETLRREAKPSTSAADR